MFQVILRMMILVGVGIGGSCALAGQQLAAQSMDAQGGAVHKQERWSIVVHGGAGDIEQSMLGAVGDAGYRASLKHATEAGAKVLDSGGTALDAVEAAVRAMEDDPLFNSSRGAVFNAEGKTELDAALMEGATLRAGSVAGVTHTRYPITLARAVMEKTKYVMLVGPGADAYSIKAGMEQEPAAYFFTESRWQSLVKQLEREGKPVPPRPEGAPSKGELLPVAQIEESEATRRYGTVGAVALDRDGNVAAATSTGGMQGKMPGRVGDSPIIGAGTYASNAACAVSGTGTGEYYIRLTLAREVANLVQYKGMKLQQALDTAIHTELQNMKGDGGLIAVTPDGQLGWSFNTRGMFRARQREGEPIEVRIYDAEENAAK